MTDEERVAGHLKTLSICYYVYAGLAACGSCFGAFYIAMGAWFPRMAASVPAPPEGQPPQELMQGMGMMFAVIGAGIMVFALTIAVLCFLSARALSRRRNRTLSLVTAGIICLNVPIGTMLGVFTFIVLMKPEAQRLYGEQPLV